MAYTLLDFFQRQGLKLVEASLHRVVGKAASYVREEAHYRQTVILPAWDTLPLPIRRMMGRDTSRWEELYRALRSEVLELKSGVIGLRPNATALIKSLVYKLYGPGAEAAPVAPHSEIPPPPPLAQRVLPDEVGSIPIARPVHAPEAISPVAVSPPSAEEIAIGIDLGTTYSLVAFLDARGRPTTIPNNAGDLLTPSVVLFEDEGTIVGKEAVLASAMEPDRVAECVKRDMGAKVYRKKIHGEFLPPEVISSLILRSLKADAERKLGHAVRKAVITVPAYFEETRRRATMDAGKLAGLDVLDIINEPTAAAIAYGYSLGFLDRSCQLHAERPMRVLVYDLGGGTFDVTIVEIQGRHFRALATDGDVCLGGKDWDEKLVEIAAERIRQQFREDPCENPLSMQELWLSAESAKRSLTERKKAALFVNHLGTRHKVEVTREEFEEATAPLLERTRLTAELVVRQAGLTWEQIDRVLLVGGSTRMPMVPQMLQQLTGKVPDRSVSADEAVAHGAALYADLLAPLRREEEKNTDFTVTNVSSHSLGIQGANPETGRKINKILIPKNSPLPHTTTKLFKTLKPNQHNVLITVLEGESERPEICTRIGVCAIRDLPPELPAGWPVLVSYTYDANGRLHVTARVKGHDVGITTDFQRENRMPDEELELWAHFVQQELDVSE